MKSILMGTGGGPGPSRGLTCPEAGRRFGLGLAERGRVWTLGAGAIGLPDWRKLDRGPDGAAGPDEPLPGKCNARHAQAGNFANSSR